MTVFQNRGPKCGSRIKRRGGNGTGFQFIWDSSLFCLSLLIIIREKKNKKGYRLLRLSGGSILEVLVGEVGDQTTDQDDAVETDTHAGAVAGARGTGGRLGLRARSRVTGLMELC